ncbi:hypothetical protein H6G89_18905 [Oscillatoria sp. FACHB-1407]|uniref:hypothetical protein n=1 Tax=Oscillatoria sp. FACHB-1407 TaxID=2692847 RepID=UPI0016890834|nr:hypothetical protein [Oscillatoria sp. FACHB-1407]MBD2463109.1 hypothetical protein [Oscillatoria sp. FACHB-1407]
MATTALSEDIKQDMASIDGTPANHFSDAFDSSFNDVSDEEFVTDTPEQTSLFLAAKLTATSIVSLMATCGIGSLLTNQTTVQVNPVVEPATSPDITAPTPDRRTPTAAIAQPTVPTIPEPSNSVEFSSSQKTQQLVESTLTEYHALLQDSLTTNPPAIRPAPPVSTSPQRVESLSSDAPDQLRQPELNAAITTTQTASPTIPPALATPSPEVPPPLASAELTSPELISPELMPPNTTSSNAISPDLPSVSAKPPSLKFFPHPPN